MLLGDLLSRFTDESLAAEAILSLADLGLLTALRQRAEANGLELGTFAALAVQRYAEEASDEEWVTPHGRHGPLNGSWPYLPQASPSLRHPRPPLRSGYCP